MKRGWTWGQHCNCRAWQRERVSPLPQLSLSEPPKWPQPHASVNSARLGFSLHLARLQISRLSRSGLHFSLPASVFWPYLNHLPLPLAFHPCLLFSLFYSCMAFAVGLLLPLQSHCSLLSRLSHFFPSRLRVTMVLLLPSMGCLPSAAAVIRETDPN